MIYMWNLVKDLENGKIGEKIVVKYLNENIYIEDNLKLYKQGTQVDFRNKEIIGELKCRTTPIEAYKKTFFGYNKIKYLKEQNDNRVWKFYFLFTDGLYVWTFNKDQYEVRDFNHRERGVIDQAYVDKKYLEKLTSLITSNSQLPDNWEKYIN